MSARAEFSYSFKQQTRLTMWLRRRLFGPLTGPLLFVAVAALSGIGGAGLALLMLRLAPDRFWLFFLPLAFVLMLLIARGRRFVNTALARRACRLGDLDGAACVAEALPDVFVWSGPDWRYEIRWAGVDLVEQAPGAIMVVSRANGYFVPDSAFADDAARQAFIAACAEHMTPEARHRSGLAS